MPRPEPVGAISQPPRYGSVDDDGLGFIRCVGRLQPEIHEVWTFSYNIITTEIHPTSRFDVVAFVGDCFVTDYLSENGRRVTMFERKLINGIFKWMGVPDFLRTNGPPLD